ncbi:MAG: DUF115 domain-containing protein [Tepidimonas sp.]|uniref:motility associated factor glycosyltransferase family protein n=1 Tax=Tepidimonas sp. TaxID=2002775 RepID=UPI00259F0CC3|nr:6-hydroxymethylpterin diphosphokinase MptE-like protein [Tepidimonas sp.]MDM7456737.1 DUF115 domain-containing protein [Tepidimonas sp.]
MPDQPPTVIPNDRVSLPVVPPLQWRVNRFGERTLEAVNGLTFDKLGAAQTLQEAFRGELRCEDTLYIMAGSDSGHLIRHVLREPPPAGTRYLFVEPPQVHAALRAAGLLDDLPAHVRCATADDWMEAASELRLSDYLYIDRVEVVFSLAARSAEAPDHTQLGWALREAVSSLHWRTVGLRGNQAFIACQLTNAADNTVPAGVWRGRLKGQTGVLLAGGPSLDAALDWVRQHRDRLVVLAVSRISRRLLQVGLQPDFVFSVDPTEMSYEISRDMLRFGPEVVFVHQYHVNPRLVAQWPYASYYLGSLLPWSSPLNPSEPLHGIGPTVTNTALQFAAELGLNRVILAGVDLCFTPEGYTHAEGSNERKAGPRFDLTSLEVETNDGRRASTTADFAAAIETLAQQARHLRERGIGLVNPSASAARVEAVDHIPWIELRLDDATGDKRISPPNSEAFTNHHRLRHAERVIRELQRRIDELQRLEDRLHHAHKVTGKLFAQDGTIRNRNLRLRLERFEAELDSEHPDLSRLIKSCSLQTLLRSMKPVRELESLDAQAVQEALRGYYDAYLSGARQLRNWIEQALAKARRRRREYSGQLALPELAQTWMAHGEPGRVLGWLLRHGPLPADAPAPIHQAVDQLQHALQMDLDAADGVHLRRARAHGDLRAALVRLEQLFAQRNIDGLRNTLAGLERVADAQAASPYVALARGLLAELEDRSEDALAYYDQVLQSPERGLWKTALVRVASWALGRGETATASQALQCLADLQPAYRIQYGDFLAATGQIGQAIDVYERHLVEHPQDLDAMARLARLMVNAGALQAAALMADHLERHEGGASMAASVREWLRLAASETPPSSAADR